MRKFLVTLLFSLPLQAHNFAPCDENGMADIYPCESIDLMHRVHIDTMGGDAGSTGSDIWGWTDPQTDKEYALMTLSFGTSFVDITDPTNPIVLGSLPTATNDSIWRDVKTYNNHAYIVSEATGHGMQVFDLTQLRNVDNPPVIFSETGRYTGFGSAHNIVINEASAYAYAVGTTNCNGGLHMVNLKNPASPTNAGCFDQEGYTHDAQCVNYIGPDPDHQGKEICFNSNEDTVTIVDVTNKNAPRMIAKQSYNGSNITYTHQGWLTEDQRYFLMNDELDEQLMNHPTRTYIWDMLDIDQPRLLGFYSGPTFSIDHNLYIKGNLAYLSNYTSGLRIVDISNIGNAELTEIASFDTFPANDQTVFRGAWSSYPFFPSGTIITSDFDGGLFIFQQTNVCPVRNATQGLSLQASGDNTITLDWSFDLQQGETYAVYRSQGGCDANNFEKIADNIDTTSFIDNEASGQVAVGYRISKTSTVNGKSCESERSICVETQTTGHCTAPPIFDGLNTAGSADTSICGMNLQWPEATSVCNAQVSYDVFKSSDPTFTPDDTNRVASRIEDNQWQDFAVQSDTQYYYLVRAIDESSGKSENNSVKISGKALGPTSNGQWSAGAEIGDSGLNQTTRHLGWEQTNSIVHSGERSYWSQNNPSSCQALTTESVTLTPGASSVLEFWTAYDIDFQFDGGVVEISTDNENWQPVNLNPDYPNRFRFSNNACGYDTAEPSFTGTDLKWQKHQLDLSEYQGQDIKLRWNYSSNPVNNGQGWFIDDISISNIQTQSQCQTAQSTIQPGLWFDTSHQGHGFAIEPVGFDDLYYTVFYTYDDQGFPEWFVSLTALNGGILNRASQADSLQRFLYDYTIDPSTGTLPIMLDEQQGANQLSIDFNGMNTNHNDTVCADKALAQWQLGAQQDSWCLQPLIAQDNVPQVDFGGTWWSGSNDSGWGLSLAFRQETIIVVVYFYDAQGNPRWVIGQNSAFSIGQSIDIDLNEIRGYGRTETPIETKSIPAGQLSLILNSNTNTLGDGNLTIDVTYQGTQGGQWSRSNIAIENFTQPH